MRELQIEYEGEYMTLDSFLALAHEAERIRRAIVVSGGGARKSAVEKVLMNMTGISRYEAHEILNHCEYQNMSHRDRNDEPDISDYAAYLEGVELRVVIPRGRS